MKTGVLEKILDLGVRRHYVARRDRKEPFPCAFPQSVLDGMDELEQPHRRTVADVV